MIIQSTLSGVIKCLLGCPRKLVYEYTMMSPTLDVMGDTVDGNQKSGRENQLRLVVYPSMLEGFIHPRWWFAG